MHSWKLKLTYQNKNRLLCIEANSENLKIMVDFWILNWKLLSYEKNFFNLTSNGYVNSYYIIDDSFLLYEIVLYSFSGDLRWITFSRNIFVRYQFIQYK